MDERNYQAIIFDFFDVIHRDPFITWLNKHGLERSGKLDESSRLVDLGHIDDEEFYRRLADASSQELSQVEEIFKNTTYIDWEMVKLIKQLHRDYTTALLSNSSSQYVRDIMSQHELHGLFDSITISADIESIKPSPEIFQHALQNLNLPAKEVIFIDDNTKNVSAALKLGIKSIHYKGDIDELKRSLAELGVKIPAT